MRVFNFESQSEFKRTKYVIQFSQYLKIPHYEKRSYQTIIFGQILVVLNLTISIKCYKQKKNTVDCRDHNSKKSNVIELILLV